MVRFIYVCMGVVALAFLSIVAQFAMDGIGGAQQEIAARNVEPAVQPENDVAATDMDMGINPEDLNAIETTAGAEDDSDSRNQTFGEAFTSEAPQALQDTAAPAAGLEPMENAAE